MKNKLHAAGKGGGGSVNNEFNSIFRPTTGNGEGGCPEFKWGSELRYVNRDPRPHPFLYSKYLFVLLKKFS